MTDLKKSILACIEQLDVSSASLAKAISIIESQAIQIAELEAACATAEQSKDKWVAIVRATNKGYAMELSKYIAYALPEGTHELYAAPQAPQSRDSVIEECAKVCDAMANEVADQRQFALDLCSDAIRALKSQQDAAIESQRSGNGESS